LWIRSIAMHFCWSYLCLKGANMFPMQEGVQ
jgi:hypothetical protein